ncbi:Luciferin 4-monooxygenase [Papilio xuthus]|uniref:Luciferin 4-monooxygenase n=1 Tax=Papilio xuthus TaxID=66420 RepID=A0A194Q101_PAPXU|nr:Luciferin 4-monooxygenase [Papilio xuthus]
MTTDQLSAMMTDYPHLGHVFYHSMKNNPNSICQIDAATGEEETRESVLRRSVRLARALRREGLRPGHVAAVGGHNHIDLHIPFYAALMNGHPIVGVDPLFKLDEIKSLFKITQPRIVFCQRDAFDHYKKAADDLALNLKILTFEDGEHSLKHFLETNEDEESESEFKVADFDLEKTYVFLTSTSGTTGTLKVAAFRHRVVMEKFISFSAFVRGPKVQQMVGLNLSPVQWISGIFNAITMPIMKQTKLQTSRPADIDHIIDIINKYKPNTMLAGPSLITSLTRRKHDVDLNCFNSIIITGEKINPEVSDELRAYLQKNTIVMEAYGMTETLGAVLLPNISGPKGSCGRPMADYTMKLVNPDTGLEIKESFVPGELWVKGLCFTEYLKNPEETRKAFSDDGFLKTGDLMYRDDDDNLYFVERIKMLIKCRNAHDGQRPAAFVVRAPCSNVTAKDIKDLVASKLAKHKELTGGVAFVDSLPMTSTGKLARGNMKHLILNVVRE